MSTIPDSHDDSNCRRGSPQLDDFPEYLKCELYYEKLPTAVGDGFEDIPLPDDPCPISGSAGRTQDIEPSTQNAEHTVPPPGQCAPESLSPRPYVSVSKRTEPGPSEFLKAVLEAARQKPLPAVAARYYLSGVKLLVALCCELQTAAGGETFFLSCRDAAALVAPTAPFQTVSRWLGRLVRDGVLIRIARGTQATQKASEFRYIGDTNTVTTDQHSRSDPLAQAKREGAQ
jgi:hypothetical protein